jgi:hypothetical protein
MDEHIKELEGALKMTARERDQIIEEFNDEIDRLQNRINILEAECQAWFMKRLEDLVGNELSGLYKTRVPYIGWLMECAYCGRRANLNSKFYHASTCPIARGRNALEVMCRDRK